MANSREQKGYNTRRITEKLDEPTFSEVDTIQLQSQFKYKVEIDEDLQEGLQTMIEDRNEEVHLIEQEVSAVHGMYDDMARLVNVQQPTIDRIVHTLEAEAKVNIEVGAKAIEEAEAKKRWCVIM